MGGARQQGPLTSFPAIRSHAVRQSLFSPVSASQRGVHLRYFPSFLLRNFCTRPAVFLWNPKMRWTYKETHSLTHRKRMAEGMRNNQQHGFLVPIVLQKTPNARIHWETMKFVSRLTSTFSHFSRSVMKEVQSQVGVGQKLFFIVNNAIIPPPRERMCVLHENHRDEDGFLYIAVSDASDARAVALQEAAERVGGPPMRWIFKDRHSLAQRKEEYERMMFDPAPREGVPVVLQKTPNAPPDVVSTSRFIFNHRWTVEKAARFVRQKHKWHPNDQLYFLIDNIFLWQPTDTIGDLGMKYHDKDGFLYLALSPDLPTAGRNVESHAEDDHDDAQELEALRKERVCKVCLVANSEVAFLPCGHCVTCQGCAEKLMDEDNRCPFCRTTIEDTQRIFLV